MLRRRLLHDDQGAALVAAITLLAAMLGLGLALLSIVDTQSKASGVQREADAAFNLADSALSSTAFVLSRNWPSASSASQPWTQGASCSQQVISGGVASTSDTSIAGQIQKLVAQASAARNGPSTATWSVKICDAGNETTWSSALLARAPYDATGRRTLTDPNGNQFMVRRLWVRAEATVNGAKRAASSLVQVTEKPAFPAGYGTVSGRFSFLGGAGTTINQVLTGPLLGGLTNTLLNTNPVVSGKMGIRCGLLSDLCVEAVAATLSEIPLASVLAGNNVVQYGTPTVVSRETLRLLRERAARDNTFYTAADVPAGGSCIPAGAALSSQSVVYVQRVGTGTATNTCKITAAAARTIGTVVVEHGRIDVEVTAPVTTALFTGVIYGANSQGDKDVPVVRLAKGAKVRGAVYVDGGAPLAIEPPAFDTNALVDSLLCPGLLCASAGLLKVLGVSDLVTALVNGKCLVTLPLLGCTVQLPGLGLGPVLAGLTTQITNQGYSPVVEYHEPTVSAQTVYGSSGAVQGTFRQVPAN